MIPLSTPNLSGNEGKYLQECITSTFVSSVGPFVKRFEEKVAQASGAHYAVATSSGTTGLHIALLTVGVEPGDLVIIPSFTFIASANAVAHCGAVPWVMDIDPSSWTLDPALVEAELKSQTERQAGRLIHKMTGRKVAAILPVYTLGVPADIDPLREIARQFKLPLVVDAAPALGALYKGKEIGELGELTVFSFNGNKTITAGAGGAIVGREDKLLERARHLSTTARVNLAYDHDCVGYNYRMTNLQAAVGCAQLERLEEFVAAKIRIGKNYNEAFASIEGIGFFPQPAWGKSVCWFSGITLQDPALPSVGDMTGFLKEAGIESRSFWKPIHLQLPYRSAPRTLQPVTEAVWDKVLTLPCSTHLSEADQKTVIDAVRKILTR